MTNAIGAGIVLEYRFRDSFCFHVRLAELLDSEMLRLIERLRIFHGEIVESPNPSFCDKPAHSAPHTLLIRCAVPVGRKKTRWIVGNKSKLAAVYVSRR